MSVEVGDPSKRAPYSSKICDLAITCRSPTDSQPTWCDPAAKPDPCSACGQVCVSKSQWTGYCTKCEDGKSWNETVKSCVKSPFKEINCGRSGMCSGMAGGALNIIEGAGAGLQNVNVSTDQTIPKSSRIPLDKEAFGEVNCFLTQPFADKSKANQPNFGLGYGAISFKRKCSCCFFIWKIMV